MKVTLAHLRFFEAMRLRKEVEALRKDPHRAALMGRACRGKVWPIEDGPVVPSVHPLIPTGHPVPPSVHLIGNLRVFVEGHMRRDGDTLRQALSRYAGQNRGQQDYARLARRWLRRLGPEED